MQSHSELVGSRVQNNSRPSANFRAINRIGRAKCYLVGLTVPTEQVLREWAESEYACTCEVIYSQVWHSSQERSTEIL